jgi:hypothetical protein
MKRRLPRICFGLGLGLAARFAMPGHHPGTAGAAIALCLLGSLAGEVIAEHALPSELIRNGSFALAGIGSLAALLVQALVVG